MTLTRDSVILTVGAIGSAATALVGAFGIFPWIPEHVQHTIAIVAFITTPILTFLKSSPLPVSFQGHVEEVKAHNAAALEAYIEGKPAPPFIPIPPMPTDPVDVD